MNRLWVLSVASVILLLLGLTSTTQAAQTRYRFVDLGTLGGEESSATDVNDLGQVVGKSNTAGGSEHAFLWQQGEMLDLGTLGGACSEARGVNNAGQVVGESSTGTGNHAFLWHDGRMHDLHPAGASYSAAFDINNRGEVVLKGDQTLYVWQGGQAIVRGSAGYALYDALITDFGRIVGQSYGPTGHFNGLLYEPGGGSRPFYCHGADANELGWVVGCPDCDEGECYSRAVIWQATAGSRFLGTLGGDTSCAYGTNDAGQVVGSSTDSEGVSHAFLWEDSLGMQDLNGLVDCDWQITSAEDINGKGWIIASARRSETARPHAVLLIPITEAVGAIRPLPSGSGVTFYSIPVTAVFGDWFYVESDDRSGGIRVLRPGHTLRIGDRATVEGTVQTDAWSRERYVYATRADRNGTSTVLPLGMHVDGVCGLDWSGQWSQGLNRTALLVKTWGEVVSEGNDWFIVRNGSGKQLKVQTPPGVTIDPEWRYVAVTGVNAVEALGYPQPPISVLRVRSQDDIVDQASRRPEPVAVSPGEGSLQSGVKLRLACTYADPNLCSDIAECRLLVNTSMAQGNAVCLRYDANEDKLYVRNDSDTGWVGGHAPGTENVIENGSCRLYCAGTAAERSGTTLTVRWLLLMKASMAGKACGMWLSVRDDGGLEGDWRQLGAVSVAGGPDAAPRNLSLTPPTGWISPYSDLVVESQWLDDDGADDISECCLLLNNALLPTNAIYLWYDNDRDLLYLRDDANTSWLGGHRPGSFNTVVNNQCQLYCEETVIDRSDGVLRIRWRLRLQSLSWNGAPCLAWLRVVDSSGDTDNWEQFGDYVTD